MANLDISTSHNIIVSVELATTFQRCMATIIDYCAISFYCFIATLVSFGNTEIYFLLLMPVILFYHLIFEYFNNGQSLGKKLLKLKVVSLTGEDPTINDYVMRWMFRLLDLTASFGMLAMVFISSSKKKQRIGDILANTAVVKLENERFMNLEMIKSITEEEHGVSYPQVAIYSDADMLLLKEAIRRIQQSNSDENKKLINDLTVKISRDLKLKSTPRNQVSFLSKLLTDYIVLTR